MAVPAVPPPPPAPYSPLRLPHTHAHPPTHQEGEHAEPPPVEGAVTLLKRGLSDHIAQGIQQGSRHSLGGHRPPLQKGQISCPEAAAAAGAAATPATAAANAPPGATAAAAEGAEGDLELLTQPGHPACMVGGGKAAGWMVVLPIFLPCCPTMGAVTRRV